MTFTVAQGTATYEKKYNKNNINTIRMTRRPATGKRPQNGEDFSKGWSFQQYIARFTLWCLMNKSGHFPNVSEKKVVLANSELLVSIRASSSAGMGGMFSIPAVGVRLVFRQAQVAFDSPDLGKFPTATRRPALADHPHPLPCGRLVDVGCLCRRIMIPAYATIVGVCHEWPNNPSSIYQTCARY